MVSAANGEVLDRLRKTRDLHLDNKISEAKKLLEDSLQEDSRNAKAHWRMG